MIKNCIRLALLAGALSGLAFGAASAPSATFATGTIGGVQATVTNPNTGPTVVCMTFTGVAPATNGDGATCSSGFALQPTASGTPALGYFSIIVPGLTVKLIAGISGSGDSSVVTYTPTVNTQTIRNSNFGFQCGPGETFNCPPVSNVPTWPSSTALPCSLRLHDSKTEWSVAEPASGSFVWTTFDGYMTDITNNNPCFVMQQFTAVPCWASGAPITSFTGTSGTISFTTGPNGYVAGSTLNLSGFTAGNTGLNGQTVTVSATGLSSTTFQATVTGSGYSSGAGASTFANTSSQCQGVSGGGQLPNYGNNSPFPPEDLGTGPLGSSPTFNTFVSTFLSRCASDAGGTCPIKGYQMWNEWDLCVHWQGTAQQLYSLIAYPVQLIRAAIPNAVIFAPSVTPAGTGIVGCQTDVPTTDLSNWLTLENTNGRLSDVVDWHLYLTQTSSTIAIPETQYATYGTPFLTAQNGVAGWVDAPWADTEVNFNAGTGYSCPINTPSSPPTTYSSLDCTGMIVRFQLLHDCSGPGSATTGNVGLFWYYWNDTFINATQPPASSPAQPTYPIAYKYAQNYLTNGYCTSQATNISGSTWTANFVQSTGTAAQWVWTTSESGTTYTVPAGYSDFRDLTGAKTFVLGGQTIAITVEPVMLEQASVGPAIGLQELFPGLGGIR